MQMNSTVANRSYFMEKAMNNVQTTNIELFVTRLSSKKSILLKLDRELQYASKVRVKYCYHHVLDESLWRLLNGSQHDDQNEYSLEIIVNEALGEHFMELVKSYIDDDEIKRDISSDTVIFIPYQLLTDHENAYLFEFKHERGYLQVLRNVSKEEPALFSTAPEMVDLKFESFIAATEKFQENIVKISSLIEKRMEEEHD
jgi:hypothetical protein